MQYIMNEDELVKIKLKHEQIGTNRCHSDWLRMLRKIASGSLDEILCCKDREEAADMQELFNSLKLKVTIKWVGDMK